MKTFVSTLLASIVVLIFGYYFNLEKADIRYTLSERIPISFLDGNNKGSVQQLEIKNVGNAEARNVLIVIKGEITNYQLEKYSQADEVKEFKKDNSLEIAYLSLPPQGSLKLILKSVGMSIQKWDISIKHSKGIGTEALAQQGMSTSTILTGSVLIFYILLFTFFGIRWRIDDFVRDSNYNPDKILKRTKPYFISDKKWNHIRKESIKQKIDKETYRMVGSVDESISYILLSNDKPEYLDDEEWNVVLKKASEKLYDLLLGQIIADYSHYTISKVINIPFPKNLPERLQSEIKEKLNKLYFKKLSEDLEYTSAPVKFIEDQRLNVLTDNDINKLKKQAYDLEFKKLPNVFDPREAKIFLDNGRPKWITDDDYELMESRASMSIELDSLKQKYIYLFTTLKNIINQRSLESKKPDVISEEEWNKLVEIEKDIRILSEENRKKDIELSAEKNNVQSLKEKIERQLNIIHEFLNDPSVINRIEEYNNVFAPGNFENLQRLASTINNLKSSNIK
ncbi:MAG: hypothetical protein HY808_13870 [Nitrospirae bacterium]|nr:hypothetical protein [Nitrospirota bacterium]